jgi:hypothetical protein
VVVTVVLVEKLLIFQTTNTGNAGIHTHNITNSGYRWVLLIQMYNLELVVFSFRPLVNKR